MRWRRFLLGVGVVLVLLVLAGGGLWWHLQPKNPDALWRIVSQQCVPHQQKDHNPAPCAEVNLDGGYVVFKDRDGPLQYLLMPVARITGIESPQLLDSATPNFFWLAWQARHFMNERYGKPLPDSAVSLAINSPTGRTQNQLHIHISCLRPDVRSLLDSQAADLNAHWQALGVKLGDERWLARRVTSEELAKNSLFMTLSNEVPGARENMGYYGLVLATLPGGSFVALATERNLLRLNRASGEVLQDHQCKILHDAALK